ncbi:nucleotide exchange factor GrpE [Herbaspirillum sp. HC18]|nr:nucleotide exchange factor GrpE [Herbaspirillum sp. HC18]
MAEKRSERRANLPYQPQLSCMEQAMSKENLHIYAEIEALHLALRAAVSDAEYARQRAQADLAHAIKFGIEGFAKALLPFKDTLEMALAVETSDAAALKAGLELSLKQLQEALEKHGLREICPQPGEPFDVDKHRPLVKLGSEDSMRSVACTEQKGYEINGRVIRPAFVLTR